MPPPSKRGTAVEASVSSATSKDDEEKLAIKMATPNRVTAKHTVCKRLRVLAAAVEGKNAAAAPIAMLPSSRRDWKSSAGVSCSFPPSKVPATS